MRRSASWSAAAYPRSRAASNSAACGCAAAAPVSPARSQSNANSSAGNAAADDAEPVTPASRDSNPDFAGPLPRRSSASASGSASVGTTARPGSRASASTTRAVAAATSASAVSIEATPATNPARASAGASASTCAAAFAAPAGSPVESSASASACAGASVPGWRRSASRHAAMASPKPAELPLHLAQMEQRGGSARIGAQRAAIAKHRVDGPTLALVRATARDPLLELGRRHQRGCDFRALRHRAGGNRSSTRRSSAGRGPGALSTLA